MLKQEKLISRYKINYNKHTAFCAKKKEHIRRSKGKLKTARLENISMQASIVQNLTLQRHIMTQFWLI